MEYAKLFKSGGSQAVRLPRSFRFGGGRVKIRRDGSRVVLEPATRTWSDEFLAEFSLSPDPVLAKRRQPRRLEREDIEL